ncbi:MAG: endonuclease/exonuclease/phosphatase family protein [Pseudomonadota bacterium]
MAIPFVEPDPPLNYNGAAECRALDAHFRLRRIPRSQPNRLLLASWNIANLGAQDRPRRAFNIIAHILKRFDLVAVQEVNDNFRAFLAVMERMGRGFDYVLSDTAGNDERLGFVYRKSKVGLEHLFGEIALRPKEYPRRNVKVHFRENRRDRFRTLKNFRFVPFDRNPMIGSFVSGDVNFVLANVHLYFGAFQRYANTTKQQKKYARRVLEIFALARWANDRSTGGNALDRDIVLLGDMNIPNMNQNEATVRALEEFGWRSVEIEDRDHIGTRAEDLSHIGGTNLGNDKTYDQIAFAPQSLGDRVLRNGVFDFDNAIFARKWREISGELSHGRAVGLFNRYVKHHISDHRPIWVQLEV